MCVIHAARLSGGKLNLLGAGTFVNSHGRWAAGIGLAIFAAIAAISLHSFSGNSDGESGD